MNAKLNSEILPIISVGMYNSLLSPDVVISDDYLQQNYEEDMADPDRDEPISPARFWAGWDNAKYVKHIEKLAAEFLNGSYTKDNITVTIKTGEIYSPKEYNFKTDNIDLFVEFPKKEVLGYAKANYEKFNSYLKEHYSDSPGFWSFTPNNFTDWLVDYKLDNVLCQGAILRFWFENEIDEVEKTFKNFEDYFVHEKTEDVYEFYDATKVPQPFEEETED